MFYWVWVQTKMEHLSADYTQIEKDVSTGRRSSFHSCCLSKFFSRSLNSDGDVFDAPGMTAFFVSFPGCFLSIDVFIYFCILCCCWWVGSDGARTNPRDPAASAHGLYSQASSY